MLLVERFRHTVENTPLAVAVEQGDRQATYGELGRLSANVARHLLEHGLSAGDRVALAVANSVEYIGIFYGIWAAGGTTVALNTQAKAKDIANWLRHAGANWLFIDENHPELDAVAELTGSGLSLVRVRRQASSGAEVDGDAWSDIVGDQGNFPHTPLDESDIASIIYTSGTTGDPKGVTLSHGNLRSNIDSILAYLHLTQADSIVNVLPFYYSYGNSVLHTHVAVGAKLILENSLLYPHRVVEQISSKKATGFSGVPTTFSLLLGRVKLENYDLSGLRYITQAGGAMPPTLIDKLTATLPQAELFIMYGQTEATARLSYLPCDKVHEKRGSIGFAIPGVTLKIMDKSGARVKPGQTGEICARGANIMQGYWHDEEKTAQVIVDGWLHTGDLAHYDDEDYIYIDGRSSDMIKSGGNRISPKEVEEVIQEIEGVQDVAVVGVPDDHLGESIEAFVVPLPDAKIDVKTVQRHCKRNLAIYKIPKSVKFIDSLPKTASGKVQRFLLHELKKQPC